MSPKKHKDKNIESYEKIKTRTLSPMKDKVEDVEVTEKL